VGVVSAVAAQTEKPFVLFTASGSTFDLKHLDLTDLTVEDIALSLSYLFRWRGSVPVSVAQHSVVMARCASTENVARWCLMHDAPEMFLSDVPSPIKEMQSMGTYRRAESRAMRAVATRFDLPGTEPREVHRLDMRARRSEVEEFLPSAIGVVRNLHPLPVQLAPAWTPAKARREFISEAQRLGIE
jgi:hypothetical protein